MVGSLNLGAQLGDATSGFSRILFGFGAGVALYRFGLGLRVPSMPLPVFGAALLAILLSPIHSQLFMAAAVFLFFPLIILSGANSETSMTRFSTFSGDISYPLYILHWPIYNWVYGALKVSGVMAPKLLVVSLALLAAMTGAVLILRYVDVPVRAMLANLTRPRKLKPDA